MILGHLTTSKMPLGTTPLSSTPTLSALSITNLLCLYRSVCFGHFI